MKRITIIIAATMLLCGLTVASCSLMLNSQERKMIGKWHEKNHYTEDFTTVYYEGWDNYNDDKTGNSLGQFTLQMNIGKDGVNFIVYVKLTIKTSGIWKIEHDNMISKNDVVEFSDLTISSNENLNEDYLMEIKNNIKTEMLPQLRDEALKKDTTEIVLLNDTEFKYKDDEGTVYTMTKIK